MKIIFEPMVDTLVENTKMKKVYIDDKHRLYEITPNEGYKLHDNRLDAYEEYDEEGNPVGTPSALGFQRGATTCTVEDFVSDKCKFYAILESENPDPIQPATETDYINALERLGVHFDE